ncbi:uncharacterized protein LOC123327333 [Drosophila simulans]|uniref:uncharacterized protein LOC123327333 n=1 Tax=Drosophila simulans TaxID=7240 RepID=UPI001D117F77|nr:uncharacterized protein LOC123327333 [Drosophila simulans]
MSFPFAIAIAIGCCPDRPMILASVEPSATQEHCRCCCGWVEVDVDRRIGGSEDVDVDVDPCVWTMERFGDRCTQPELARCHWRVIKMYRSSEESTAGGSILAHAIGPELVCPASRALSTSTSFPTC